LPDLDSKVLCRQDFNWCWHLIRVRAASSLAQARNAVVLRKCAAAISPDFLDHC